jgi:branched-chain amino acid transport system ATP-binding protein
MTGLVIDNIDARYGKSRILHGVSLAIAPGSVVTLLGRNGAGKTTTIRSICGLLSPTAGTITLEGQQISGLRADQITRAGVACVTEGRDIFSHLTVRENLKIACRRDAGQAVDKVVAQFPLIERLLDRPGGALSGGEQQLAAIGRALLLEPKVLLLDEPSQGLAPVMVDRVVEVLTALKQTRLTMLVVEQKIDVALELAEEVFVIDSGRIVHQSAARDFEQHTEVIQCHLGVGH